ncbi:cation:proton antiporter [Aquirhabdus parva]|uniref:Sodium:proton antiporter n=1 Tax=Aquirhabdus parva TaxID=2283318 RepID=A0A345P3Z8_9GAMM|nr:cation:proton antiporter [Aquirhabdus parva]AXI02007.1 sodium:proton antiporter [Aquirhabdus parva]
MPHDVSLIVLLAVGFGLALVFGYIAARLRLPPLVGYLIAGILISPNTPGVVADMHLANQLAELGVMFLMFGVGMHFSFSDLLAVRRIAIPGAILQIAVATLMGMGLAALWGWSLGSGLVFGLCLSVASTVVLLRALESRGLMDSVNGRIAIGWLVVEDLVMVLVLVLLPPMAVMLGGEAPVSAHGATASLDNIWLTIGITLAKVIAFIALMLVVGRRVFPKFLLLVSRTGSRELFTLSVVAAAVTIAYGSYVLFGVSFALGAFFAGMVVRESDFSHRAETETLPLRETFSILFFVSVGMLFNPSILIEHPLQVLGVVAVIVVGKTIAAMALVLFFRYPLNTALTVGASLAQIGEFSFILASVGLSLKLLTLEGQNLILAGALISITLNAAVFAAIEPAQRWIRARSHLARMLERSGDPLAMLPMSVDNTYLNGQVVLVGHGGVGRSIAKTFKEQGIKYVVVDENREIIEALRAQDIPAVSGDACDPAVLIQAHIMQASMLVVSTADVFDVRRMVDIARTLNPKIEAVLCTDSSAEANLLEQEKIGKVFMAKRALADSMTEHVFHRLGLETAAKSLHETGAIH